MGLLGQRTNASLSLLIISRYPSTKVTPLCTPSKNVGEMTCFSSSFARVWGHTAGFCLSYEWEGVSQGSLMLHYCEWVYHIFKGHLYSPLSSCIWQEAFRNPKMLFLYLQVTTRGQPIHLLHRKPCCLHMFQTWGWRWRLYQKSKGA